MQLPNGWKKVKLGKIGRVSSGSTPLRSQKNFYENGTIPWVKTMDLNNKDIKFTDEKITTLAAQKCKPYPSQTLLVAMYGGFNQIGRTGILTFPASINQALAALSFNEKEVYAKYVQHYLNANVEKWKTFAASSRKDPNITSHDVENFEILLPPLAEQKKIAESLSVWDSAIEKMEKLIECKEKIHAKLLNDCMHCADWKISSIESVATVKKGIQLNGENMISNGSYYVMNGGVVPSGYTDEWNTPENTVSISEGGNSCGFVAFNDEKFWAGGHCYTLIDVSPEVLPKFLFHYLKNKEKEIMKLRVGSGLPNIQKDSITNFEFKYPTKKEQKNIVEILDSSQKELSLLKQQLALYKKQKQGLMQKLLTGEWRVK